ncbi:MAG: hypothetical protein FD160_4073, partial [Caulobacteraceae bacterium]
VPALARRELTPSAPLSDEAVAARVADDLLKRGELAYFEPVADMPGFPRALSRTLAELRMSGVQPADLNGHAASADLGALLQSAVAEREKAGAVDYVTMLTTATAEIERDPSRFADHTVVLLDVAITSSTDAAFVRALIAASGSAIVSVPAGDSRTLSALALDSTPALEHPPSLAAKQASFGETAPKRPPAAKAGPSTTALSKLQTNLFATEPPAPSAADDSVVLFSAPGEGREAVEIARRLMQEAARGVPFDQMAVLLRAPQTYLGVLEHALDRAGILAWFHRGTRRPDSAGRALLALLACADEELSARRFAEYVSLGQVPLNAAGNADQWSPPADEIVDGVLPPADRAEDTQPEDEAQAATLRGETGRDVAGTLRAP